MSDYRAARRPSRGEFYDSPNPRSSGYSGRPDPRDYDDRPRRGDDPRDRRGGGGGGYDYDERDRDSRDLPPRDRRRSRGGYDGPPPQFSRSPEMDRGEGRGKRRRSGSSPPRYDRPPPSYRDERDGPPPRRYHDDRDNGYGPPRDRHGRGDEPPFDPYGPPIPVRRRPALEAPHQLPYRIDHRYFTDWFMQSSPPSLASSPEALEEAWKKYQSEQTRREAKVEFERHEKVRWFVEKYEASKEVEEERRERRKVQREGRARAWVESAEKGELDDVSFDFDEEAARRPMIMPNAATLAATKGQNGNSTTDAGSSTTNGATGEDAPMSTSAEDKEAAAEAKLKAEQEQREKDEAALQAKKRAAEHVEVEPRMEQICLGRVPPTVAMSEIEAVFKPFDGFLRLSMSEIAPHAGFLRLAWATFSSAGLAKAAYDMIVAAAPKLEEAKEEKPVEEKKAEGDEEMKEANGEEKPAPAEEKKEDDAAPSADAEKAAGKPAPPSPAPYAIGPDNLYDLSLPGVLSIRTTPLEARIRAAPSLTSKPERVKVDLEHVAKAVEALEKQAGEEGLLGAEGEKRGSEVIREKREAWEKELEGKKEELGEENYEKELATIAKRTLDLSLSYLRTAFDACYYCCVRADSPEQLADMCPRHVRRADNPVNERRQHNEAAWVEGFDARVPLLFPLETLDVRDYGGESRDEELYRLVAPHVKLEDEGKFRCKECNKLFSARKFVEKHISLKHPEFIGDALDKVAYFNNYVLDPAHIPLAQFQRENYLPSILAPPPPAPPRHASTRPGGSLADRIGKRPRFEPRDENAPKGPPPPPPAGAKLDPRASRGATAYADLDGPAGGGDDIVLPY
ncbi:hypothetical protein JCM8097_005085 [Rhodosporidiobolus ruineniae]